MAKTKHEANGSSAITNKSQNTPDTGTSTNEGHVNGSPVTVRHVTSKGKRHKYPLFFSSMCPITIISNLALNYLFNPISGEGKNAIKTISNDRTRKGSSSVSSTDQEKLKQKSSRPVLTKQVCVFNHL